MRLRLKQSAALKKSLGGFLIIMMIVCMPDPTVWAASPGPGNPGINLEEGQPPPLPKDQVTIARKSLRHIFTYGPKYTVNKETLIVGTDGREESIKDMRVPCDAEVSYQVVNGIRIAKRIDIKRVATGARWQWVSERPE